MRDAAPGDVLVERSPMAPAGLRLGRSLDDYQAGHFDNLDTLRLRWVEADYFEYVPDPARPFAFHPPGRAPVIPQAMWTNGGSIPAWAQATATILGRSLSPWGFALGYIVHDWEFDAHHHGVSSKSFEDVRDTLMEAVKTMMAEGIGRVTRDDLLFRAIYIGVNSQTALDLWNASPPGPTG